MFLVFSAAEVDEEVKKVRCLEDDDPVLKEKATVPVRESSLTASTAIDNYVECS